jgi:hypothetical protein
VERLRQGEPVEVRLEPFEGGEEAQTHGGILARATAARRQRFQGTPTNGRENPAKRAGAASVFSVAESACPRERVKVVPSRLADGMPQNEKQSA